MAWWKRSATDAAPAEVNRRDSSPASGIEGAATIPDRRVPPSPSGKADSPAAKPHRQRTSVPVQAWSSRDLRPNHVVGVNYHLDGLRAIRDSYRERNGGISEWGLELEGIEAVIVAEPANKFDPNAVAVWIDGHQVGHLLAGEAEAYSERLLGLAQEGRHLIAPARVWIAQRFINGEAPASVSVTLPPATGIEPFNELPEQPHSVLPSGSALKVNVDADPLSLFDQFALRRGSRGVAATLHMVGAVLEVQVDGSKIGNLGKAASTKVGGLIQYVASRGRVAVGEVVLSGSQLGSEATLYVARTAEVSQSWLESVTVAGPPIEAVEQAGPRAALIEGQLEANVCQACCASWQRVVTRGRKPQLCPDCR